MTRDEEIEDLKSRIAAQERNHKTRSGLYRRLCKLRLSELEDKQMDENLEKSPEHRVSMAIYFLRDSIRHLQELRMANDTADQVLIHASEINNCAEWLSNLSNDIRTAVFNSQVVDLREKISVWHRAAE